MTFATEMLQSRKLGESSDYEGQDDIPEACLFTSESFLIHASYLLSDNSLNRHANTTAHDTLSIMHDDIKT